MPQTFQGNQFRSSHDLRTPTLKQSPKTKTYPTKPRSAFLSSSDSSVLRTSEPKESKNKASLHEEAQFLANFGKILPLQPGGKRPLLHGGLKGASSDPGLIDSWWNQWPDANIGMVLEDLLVIDNDNPKHGGTTEATDPLRAPTVKTPSGGTHHYYIAPQGFRKRIGVKGIDFLTGESYVLMPPSIISGVRYRWIQGGANNLGTSLIEAPKSELERLILRGGLDGGDDFDLSLCGLGNRNNTLYGLGSRLLAFGYPEDIVALMIEYSSGTMPGELESDEIERIMLSLRHYSTRASESMWRSPMDRLNETEFDHKVALLLGVLRGANAGPLLSRACVYALLASVTVTFDPGENWVSSRIERSMLYKPQHSCFLRRNGSKDMRWAT